MFEACWSILVNIYRHRHVCRKFLIIYLTLEVILEVLLNLNEEEGQREYSDHNNNSETEGNDEYTAEKTQRKRLQLRQL